MLSLFGMSVFLALFFGMLRATARRWRYLAQSYAKVPGPPLEKRHMQSAVLLGLSGFNSLKGILTVGVHQTGVSLRVLPPFSLFHDPLFIPYGDISGWRTSWYLDARSTELQFRKAHDVKMVVPAELAEWIGGFAGEKMKLRETSPPGGRAGRGWHAFTLAHAGMSLVMLGVLAYFLLAS